MKPVVISIIFVLFFASIGSASQASVLIRFEEAIGQSAKEQLIAAHGGEVQAPLHQHLQLQTLLRRLVAVIPNQDYQYSVTVLDSPLINAYSLPGGYLFVTRGLLQTASEDPQRIAGVLAHEIAHVERKHGINALLRQLGLSVLVELGKFFLDVPITEAIHVASQAMIDVVMSGYSREAELEADRLGQQYLVAAQFDSAGIIHILADLYERNETEEGSLIFASHPHLHERINRLMESAVTFWSELSLVQAEIDDPDPPEDPLGRFEIITSNNGFKLYDLQNNVLVPWLNGYQISAIEFAPQGLVIATVVENKDNTSIVFWNRQGNQIDVWEHDKGVRITNLAFSDDGKKLAYSKTSEGEHQLRVGYINEVTNLKLVSGIEILQLDWEQSELKFTTLDHQVFSLSPPEERPLRLDDPIPLVLERKSGLVTEGFEDLIEEFRLTRPSRFEL